MGRYKDILVIDLEASCWRGHPPKGQRSEIIEIGITKMDFVTKKIISSEGILIKNEQSDISEFCTKLTTIDQGMLSSMGISFKDACEKLRKEYTSDKCMWMTWGQYDRTQFLKDCHSKEVDYPFSKRIVEKKKIINEETGEKELEVKSFIRKPYADVHFNMKAEFAVLSGKQEMGVKEALAWYDLEFEGTPHRAVSDAFNTAKIYQKMCEQFNRK